MFASMLSKSDIEEYINQEKAEMRISLPEGIWKVEILDEFPSPKLAESSYFVIERGKQLKNIIILPVRKQR